MTIRQREVTFVAADGFALGGTLFEGAGGRPAGADFVGHRRCRAATTLPSPAPLCNAGARAALTYDYRGLPGSPKPSRWRKRIGMKDWAVLDLPAAAAALDAVAPGHDMVGVGQSYGGQALGLCGIAGRFTRYGMVAAMSGYHRGLDDRWAGPRMFLVGVPVASLLGTVPRWLGIGEPIPGQRLSRLGALVPTAGLFLRRPDRAGDGRLRRGDDADPGARADRRPLGNTARRRRADAALHQRAGPDAVVVASRWRRADRPSRLLPVALFANAVAAIYRLVARGNGNEDRGIGVVVLSVAAAPLTPLFRRSRSR